MTERDTERFPPWAERERPGDLAWIKENLHVFWPAAQEGHEEFGRGALAVDTTSRPTGEGHPFIYLSHESVERAGDADTSRMVEEYDPDRGMVTLLLKTEDRVSVYQIGVIRGETGGEVRTRVREDDGRRNLTPGVAL